MLLADPSIDLPFCLNWANENWTRRWDGLDNEILIAQQHSPQDDRAFMLDILRYFRDPRYIRIEGRPLLLIYRADSLPDMRCTLERWREVCIGQGEAIPYFVMCQTFGNLDPREYGFDAAVQFPPLVADESCSERYFTPCVMADTHADFAGTVYSYDMLADTMLLSLTTGYTQFPGLVPSWDNTPRRLHKASIVAGATPRRYEQWLRNACAFARNHLPEQKRFLFINAWNEWAEGAHLEPDRQRGFAWLNATRRGLSRLELTGYGLRDDGMAWHITDNGPCAALPVRSRIAVHLHLYYQDLTTEFMACLSRMPVPFDLFVSLPEGVDAQSVREAFSNGLDVVQAVTVENVPNRGADVGPMLCTFGQRLLDYEIIGHIHSKKSLHMDRLGKQWRRHLLNRIFPGRNGLQKLLFAFQEADTELFYPASLEVISPFQQWGLNYKMCAGLAQRLGIDLPPETPGILSFPAGFMFWCKRPVLQQLMALGLGYDDFAQVKVTDGTIAHAIERLLGFMVPPAKQRMIVLD